VLLLDDALSAVDMETERQILHHLRSARQGRTTLIVCHRLSAVEDAEQIAVLSHGHLLEFGTHAQLLANGSWYARMVDYQKLEQAVDEGRYTRFPPGSRQPLGAGAPAGLRLALSRPLGQGLGAAVDRHGGRCDGADSDQDFYRRPP